MDLMAFMFGVLLGLLSLAFFGPFGVLLSLLSLAFFGPEIFNWFDRVVNRIRRLFGLDPL